jgi:hypothetical protein
MNLNELHSKLIAAARSHPPSERVPLAFEKRIMARLPSVVGREDAVSWVRALWWGASACATIALLVSLWSFVPDNEIESVAGFSQEFEQTILASTEDGEAAW